ncbi:MAG: peptidase, partial [Ferruginibacter sp.]|nr:peptidase [Cytophagales bacterium]
DDIAWTLGYLYGVEVRAEDSVKYALPDLKRVGEEARYGGKVAGEGPHYVLPYRAQNAVLGALYQMKSQHKQARAAVLDEKAVVAGSTDTVLAGSVVLRGLTAAQAGQMAQQFGFDLRATAVLPDAKQHEVGLPRVAIYHSWYDTQDEGWARYTLEQRGIPYVSIDKDDLKAGGLKKKFDVILVPQMGGSAADFIHEVDRKYGPLPYTKTAEYPSHGYPDQTGDLTGGPGFEGVQQLKQFVETGGVLVTLGNSSLTIAQAGIARELEAAPAEGLFHPGSVVQVKARQPPHPVLYGYPDTFYVFRGMSPLLQTRKYNRNLMLLQYGTKPLKDEEEYKGLVMGMPDKKPVKTPEPKTTAKEAPYVLSGMVRNEQAIIGHGGIFNVPVGAGRVIAFTFDPLHRYLNHHDAPLLWNVLINWNHLGGQPATPSGKSAMVDRPATPGPGR